MAKPLKLKPSARDNRRYFIFKGTHKQARNAILKYFGIFGLAKCAYIPVKLKNHPNLSVGSCKREELSKVRAAMGLEGMDILLVSGTLKALEKKIKQ